MFPIYVINLQDHQERLELFKKRNHFLLDHTQFFNGYNGKILPRRQMVLDGLITDRNTYNARALGILKSHVELWKIAANSDHGITIMEDDVTIHKDYITSSKQILAEQKSFDLIAWGYNLDWPIRLHTAKGLPATLISYLLNLGNSNEIQLYHQIGAYGDRINQNAYLEQSITPTFVRTTMYAGLCCYTLSTQGAQKLLNHLPIDKYNLQFYGNIIATLDETGIDISMEHFYPEMDVFLSSPFLAYSDNEKSR
ncbi:glycosyltransferase family 25 protein [Commensalibacter oyaizuii]|uniref:Glycosyltransferase family 25 protein n=1 Tax=Commensalibacter oyaizuii TaxID=3043873 RepID=A0ABT6PY79_9PROT|nr:glycosyltransferase family 25 protein [Commensalibacter sp. TBRC 16381]MDI2089784.1 glycosyltransferase family 25 protein [Commensalibacter sp. TBRC 16381]